MTNLEKGDLEGRRGYADEGRAEGPKPTREVFYNLGEVKFSKGETDEAAKWYQKAADLDPPGASRSSSSRSSQLNKGDKDATIKMLEKVDRRRSDVAGSRAGQDGHRAAEEVTRQG